MSSKRVPLWAWFALVNTAVLLVGAVIVSWVLLAYMNPSPPKVAKKEPASPSSAKPHIVAKPVLPEVQMPEPPQRKELSVADVIQQVDGGIVLLHCKNSAGKNIGLGSGFVVDPSGLVATNFHVLRNASSVEATCMDGKKVGIKGCRAWREDADLAILELSSKLEGMEILPLSREAAHPQAAEVIAIGHPQGFKFTTTTGIISAMHATSDLPQPYRDFVQAPADQRWIQTNAAISGGNSGGPLLNRAGEVVGINTWIARGQNLGFAVDVRHLADLLAKLEPEAMPLAELTGPEEQLLVLIEGFKNQHQWLAEELSKASTEKAVKELIDTRHPALDYLGKLMDFADKHRGKPAAFTALATIFEIAALPDCPATLSPPVKRAADRILEEYRGDPRLTSVAFQLGASPIKDAVALGRLLLKESENRKVQAACLYSISMGLRAKKNATPEESDEAVAMLERIVRDYTDIEFEGSKLSEAVDAMLYEVKFLSIGRKPPEIEGLDQSGTAFKLSDYKGKVVVIDFWADWCPHCVRMYPLERKLVADYAQAPFALLGVNCDEPGRFQRVVGQKKVTWRNWGDGPSGPIAQNWRVNSYPTLYVLDHEGVIRYINVRDQELVNAIRELVAKAPQSANSEAAIGKLANGSFEAGVEPVWSTHTFYGRLDSVRSSAEHAKSGKASLQIESKTDDDAQCTQVVKLKPSTRYRVRGWVKTRDVVIAQEGGKHGACLSVEDKGTSDPVVGTSDWKELQFKFDSGDRTELRVGARLGYFGSTCKGTAWFDDLLLEEIPSP